MNFRNSISMLLFIWMFTSCFTKKLPDDSRIEAGKCLESLVKPVFEKDLSTIETIHEFIESFCTNFSIRQVERELRQKKLNASVYLRNCLNFKDRPEIMDKYIKRGVEIADKFSSGETVPETSTEEAEEETEEGDPHLELSQARRHSPKITPNIPQSPDSQYSPDILSPVRDLGTAQSDSQPALVNLPPTTTPNTPQSPDSQQTMIHPVLTNALKRQRDYKTDDDDDEDDEDQVTSAPKPEDELDDFTLFTAGLCNTSEFVSFKELEDPKEQSVTLSCTEDCLQSFFLKLEEVLRQEVQNVQVQGTQLQIENVPVANTFTEICVKSNVKNIQDISTIGEKWIKDYSDVYSIVNEHLLLINLNLDEKLKETWFKYSCCMKWKCSLNSVGDMPVYDWIEKNSHNPFIDLITALKGVPKREPFSRSPSPGDILHDRLQDSQDVELNDREGGTSSNKVRRQDKKIRLDFFSDEQPENK